MLHRTVACLSKTNHCGSSPAPPSYGNKNSHHLPQAAVLYRELKVGIFQKLGYSGVTMTEHDLENLGVANTANVVQGGRSGKARLSDICTVLNQQLREQATL